MPVHRINLTIDEIDYNFEDELDLPDDWVELISRLHPLTACAAWEVLTGRLTPAVVSLAQASPDAGRYRVIDILAGADPQKLGEVLEDARQALEEVFIQVLPDDPRRIVH